MASIQKRKTRDGKLRYRVLVRLKGHSVQSATFSRKTDARRWAERTESDIREGRYFGRIEARRHTLGELIDRYATMVLAPRPLPKRRDQERHLAWWKDKLGDRLLAEMTPAVIAEQKDSLASAMVAEGRRRAPGTGRPS